MKRIVAGFLVAFSFTSFSQVNLTSSLTACYALNGNSNEPINSLTGTLSAVTPTVDRFNNPNSAYRFAGNVGSYIQLPNSPLLKANAVSVSLWVKMETMNTAQYIVFTANACGSYHEGYTLASYYNNGSYKFEIVKSSSSCSQGGQIPAVGVTSLSSQTWYHVGFYLGSDSLKLYVNGSLDAAVANSNPLSYDAVKKVFLGVSNQSFDMPLTGSIDNVRFYNRKLNGSEFNQLYTQDPSCAAQVVGLPPAVAFSVSAVNLCAGNSISMTDLSANAPTSWNWQIPGATPPSASVSNPTISFQNPGNYIVSLVSSNTVGASNTATQSIVVLPKPNVFAVANNNPICLGNSTFLYANGASNYTWSTQQTGVSISVSPLVNTVYTLTGTDNNGCSNSGTVSVAVVVPPSISVGASSSSICSGNSVTLTASGANSYTWNTNQTAATITVTPVANTLYSLIGQNNTSCQSTATIAVTVNPLPTLTVTANNTNICRGSSVILTAAGAVTYTWNNNQNGSVVSLSPPSSSTYSVIGADNTGCKNTAAMTVFVDACVGLKNLANEKHVLIFPNPTTGKFTIELTADETVELLVSNSLGQVFFTKSVPSINNILSIDLSDQANGIYFLKLKIDGNSYTKKIIKN